MYPHERSLVRHLADKPFAIIGVNSDDDLEETRKVVEKKNRCEQASGCDFFFKNQGKPLFEAFGKQDSACRISLRESAISGSCAAVNNEPQRAYAG